MKYSLFLSYQKIYNAFVDDQWDHGFLLAKSVHLMFKMPILTPGWSGCTIKLKQLAKEYIVFTIATD